MKNWVCLFFTIAFFLTDLYASNGKNDPGIELPVKEIKRESLESGLIITEKIPNTSENGDETTISIQLQKKPIAEVVVSCISQEKLEGVVQNEPLTFSPENWGKNQACVIKGQDDDVVDGDRTYIIVIEVSSDKDMEYARIPPYSRSLVNLDNDHPGIVVNQQGKITSELGKSTSFTIRLSSRPGADVVIPLHSSNKTEGLVKPETLVFSPESWNSPRVVTVTGQNDFIADGHRSYSIQPGPLESSDPLYNGVNPGAINFINEDDDQAAYLVECKSFLTDEGGLETKISVKLQSKPVSNVILSFASSNPTEGDANPGQAVFTPNNWNIAQSVRIFGKDDLVADGDQPFSITISPLPSIDQNYAGLPTQTLTFKNNDNDKAGFIITGKLTETSENGQSGKIGIKLTSKPTAPLTLSFQSSDLQEGRPMLNTIQFNENDWFLEKTQTIIGVDDNKVDGDQTYRIIIDRPDTEDPLYAAIDPEDVVMINLDNEKTGLAIEKSGTETSEEGSAVTLSIRLNARPAADVLLKLSSSDASEGIVIPDHLLFTPDKWNQPESVVVKGLPDNLVDGDQLFQVLITASSEDSQFVLESPGISLTNRDINTYELIHRLEDRVTSEQGKNTRLELKLNSDPGANLVVKVESSDPGEGKVVPESLTFNESNWSSFQSVEVQGVEDDIKDGTRPYQLKIFAQGDSGGGYQSQPPLTLEMENLDNDQVGITVKQLSYETTEAEGHADFSIKLNSEPASSVIFIFSTSDATEGEMIDSHAAFFPNNWHKEQIIRVRGVKDYVVDGSQEFEVGSLGAISKDPNYNKMAFPGFKMVCHDSDQAGFTTGEAAGRLSEDGEIATFNLKLTTVPAAPVKISLSSDDQTEGIANPESLEFNADNWNQGHLITIKGLDDHEKDGDTDFHIRFSAAESDDKNYSGLSPEPVLVTNHDIMQMSVGITFNRLEFQDSMKDKLSETYAIGFSGSYVYTRNTDLDVGFYSFSSEGTQTVNKYNVDNPMVYKLDYTGFTAGARYAFWRQVLTTFVKGGVELSYWTLESLNELSGNSDSNTGSALGMYLGFGSEFTVFSSVMLALEWNYHYLTRGLGNTQLTLAVKYPF